MNGHIEKTPEQELSKQKIVLHLLPFWTSLIPPQGIASLKSFLEKHDYDVKTGDANIESVFKKAYSDYFETIKKIVPKNKRGNFYNVGHNVLQNHLMAYINQTNPQEYKELVEMIIYQSFFSKMQQEQFTELNQVVEKLFLDLEKYILDLIEQEKPGVFGLTVYSHTLATSLFAYRIVKEYDPQILTVMGGSIFSDQFPIGSPDFEFFLEKTEDFIDKIIVGEGQNLFLKLLQGELPKEQRVYTLQDIGGQTLNLATEDLPDLTDYKMELYPYLAAWGSKGCPHKCSFCTGAIYAGEYRKKQAQQLYQEMKRSFDKYGVQLFFMCDALLNPLVKDLSAEFIETDLALYWDGYLRVDEQSADLENTLQWRRGGLYRVRIGVESGSQHVLDLMGKGITVEQTKVTLANLAEAGIKTTAYIVIGHPGETEEDFQKTLDLIEEMKDDIYQVECNPFGYYYNGQPSSDQWAQYRALLYPESAREMLISQTWILNVEPSREEIYKRLNRVAEHCENLGIPNPYSIVEIYEADKRWQKLHKNAVPPLLTLEDRDTYTDECKKVEKLVEADSVQMDDLTFNF